ncbi:MAG: hypothetical protein JSV31_10315 [Desulfobacterales bacterium]|nr:MAG: hypothetical protein JSV31_10315 [Desulfobacterales bacterium]
MSYVTFKIIETRGGEFVLFLHNHSQKLVTEIFRSKNLEEVVDRLKKEMRYRKHFMSALSNYIPVLSIIDAFSEKYPDAATEEFPEEWTDPLELYGAYLQELMPPDLDLDKERNDLLMLLERHSPNWIWENRRTLVAERIFIRDF